MYGGDQSTRSGECTPDTPHARLHAPFRLEASNLIANELTDSPDLGRARFGTERHSGFTFLDDSENGRTRVNGKEPGVAVGHTGNDGQDIPLKDLPK